MKKEHKVQIKWMDKIRLRKILETVLGKRVVKENVNPSNVSLIKNLKSCFSSFIQKFFLERWQNINKSSLQKL